MSNIKIALKAAKSALDAQNYDQAAIQANTVLNLDPHNYFAQVFLGRALEKQGKLHPAIHAYKAATNIKPEDELGWKGLCNAYTSLGSDGVDGHTEAAMGLAQIYAEKSDRDQCQTIVNSIVSFAKENGTRQSYKRALESNLPTSPVYSFLEGRLPAPSFTYTKLAEITETDERERANREIGERRTRLGAKLGQVTAEVNREIFSNSDLENLYQNIIDWTNDDDLRRTYEEKLLRRAYDHLVALEPEKKADKRAQVMKLAHDMVIIKHPFQLAWQLEFEWRDVENLSDLEQSIVKEYILFFPASGMADIFRGHLGVKEVKTNPNGRANGDAESQGKSEDQDEQEIFKPLGAEDRLLLLLDGLNDSKESAFAHRVVSDYYLQIEEYEGCAETSRAARDLLFFESQKSGLQFQDTFDAVNSNLATALVFYQSPKNHPEAKNLFDDILKRKPESTAGLLGVGLIFEEQEEFQKATSFLSRALTRDPENMRIATEAAWCKVLDGHLPEGLEELQDYLEKIQTNKKTPADLRAQTLYRVGKCMWDLHTDKSSRKSRSGPYARFIAALKANPSYAPPYTFLGIYYADYAKDRKRARQCFQKAFELSPLETLAAERLARDFADAREWDIVELIVERVIDSGVVRPAPGSKRKGVSWPFAALGVVQMNKQEYPKACISFQAALRISPLDYNAWVGLGESYHSSGRYVAAQRTLEHAESLNAKGSDQTKQAETWFARYMLANVLRELGDFDKALAGYREVLVLRPNEFGVAIALLQTLVEQCNHHLETGFFMRAAEGAKNAIDTAAKMSSEHRNAFNFWKAVGDASTIFSWVPGHARLFPFSSINAILRTETTTDPNVLADLDSVTLDSISNDASSVSNPMDACVQSLSYAIVAYKQAIHGSANEIHAQAVAWYNLGLTEWRIQGCLRSDENGPGERKGSEFAKAAVRCFKMAIELEASNADFWNALGVVTTNLNARVAQHAFVRSLHLNERSARTWTNLGTLYLLQNDHELAHNAFARAQSTDPDHANAWVGEGLIALLLGDTQEALSHFTHAVEITDASSQVVKNVYVTSSFDSMLLPQQSAKLASLTQPVLALQQLQTQTTDTFAFRHLLGLLQERTGNHSAAVDNLKIVCEEKEARYEDTEDTTCLAQFMKATADLARNQLALGEFQAAAEAAETVLDLSAEHDPAVFSSDERRKVRLSAHLTGGLAQYKLEANDLALDMFRSALEESNSSPDVVCLLAQVLWAKGGDEERAVAKDQLFDCIEKHGGHFTATTLLGAMSTLDNDLPTLEAVMTDLQSMRTSEKLDASQKHRLNEILAILAELQDGDDVTSSTSVAQITAAVVLAPYDSFGWSTLSRFSDETYPVQLALKTASASVPPFGSLEAEELSHAFAETGSAGDAQRSIALCPWKLDGWQSLDKCVA